VTMSTQATGQQPVMMTTSSSSGEQPVVMTNMFTEVPVTTMVTGEQPVPVTSLTTGEMPLPGNYTGEQPILMMTTTSSGEEPIPMNTLVTGEQPVMMSNNENTIGILVG